LGENERSPLYIWTPGVEYDEHGLVFPADNAVAVVVVVGGDEIVVEFGYQQLEIVLAVPKTHTSWTVLEYWYHLMTAPIVLWR